MSSTKQKLSFASDYMEGAHPEILCRLLETNMEQTAGYGLDAYSESARKKIRATCQAADAEIFFLIGGTQANAVVIDALLRSYQGVIAAETGHISLHEAGAIEFGGHKVLTLAHEAGKITAAQIEGALAAYQEDANHDHMVMPGMVYLSQPTEYGALYSRAELEAISVVCRAGGVPLYIDGARLAYALACPENDVTLPNIARLADVFYIGGTKCGALFGEAVVFPKRDTVPHFFSIVKQHGALLAKSRITGLQFEALFTDRLYERGGEQAIRAADRIRRALREKGYRLFYDVPTNQIFLVLDDAAKRRLEAAAAIDFWEKLADGTTVMRIATSWATQDEDVERLIEIL